MQVIMSLIKERPLGIAFSGGADSVAAAHALKRFKPTLYHFNHRLIEEDNIIEANARQTATRLNLPFCVERAQERYSTGSTEAWCRDQRYAWFKTLGGTLVTAHNLSEATEGYLMNCFSGHPEHIPIPLKNVFENTLITRPFILNTKNDIYKYLIKHRLTTLVVQDPLNNDLSRRRNWIRHSILPQIKERTNVEKVVKKRYLSLVNDLKDREI